jgi:hypothetical protein
MDQVCETAKLLNAGPHIFKRIVFHVAVNSRQFRPFQPLLARIELRTATASRVSLTAAQRYLRPVGMAGKLPLRR